MTSKSSESDYELEEKLRQELLCYSELFADAFDELHSAVIERARSPGQHIRPQHDYPVMSLTDSGFPHFHEVGFYEDSAPKDYVGLLRPRRPQGLLSLIGGAELPPSGLPKGAELASFLRASEIGEGLNLTRPVYKDVLSDRPADNLVADAVERYIYVHGLDAPIDAKRREAIIRRLMLGTIQKTLALSLVIPITITHFEIDHFRLTETSYITRIPKKLQLARARINTLGSGAVKMVVGAATHAFVSNEWTLVVDSVDEVRGSLGQASPNVLDAIDSFFGALRVATGISTGYAQILWVPRGWALEHYCDLTPLYGATLRRYPSEYDNYGWVRPGATVTAEQLDKVRRVYRAMLNSQSEAIRLALGRLNACLTRTDTADAILDGTIGLELLLGDDQNQSLSYKLRLRAAALAMLHADAAYPATEIASKVKRLYEARSAIVHGRRKERTNKAAEPTDNRNAGERLIASDLLRFVLKVLLSNPEYQDPARIDEGLLLRGDKT